MRMAAGGPARRDLVVRDVRVGEPLRLEPGLPDVGWNRVLRDESLNVRASSLEAALPMKHVVHDSSQRG